MKKIYFFNGWGMDNNILNTVTNSTAYELEIINFPYKLDNKSIRANQYEITDDNKNCTEYNEIIFIAWSFGVYYLNKFLNENQYIKYSKAIGINGCPEIIGKYGINEKMFNMTLNTLTPENLLKFYKNMDFDEENFKNEKDFESIKQELIYFKENYSTNFLNKIEFYYIGKYDRIIPGSKQEKFCREKNIKYEIIDCGHYPFSYFKDIKDIIT